MKEPYCIVKALQNTIKASSLAKKFLTLLFSNLDTNWI